MAASSTTRLWKNSGFVLRSGWLPVRGPRMWPMIWGKSSGEEDDERVERYFPAVGPSS